jgi:hypothetical protein
MRVIFLSPLTGNISVLAIYPLKGIKQLVWECGGHSYSSGILHLRKAMAKEFSRFSPLLPLTKEVDCSIKKLCDYVLACEFEYRIFLNISPGFYFLPGSRDPASKRDRHLNGTGVYLCSTVLAPGRQHRAGSF